MSCHPCNAFMLSCNQKPGKKLDKHKSKSVGNHEIDKKQIFLKNR